MQYMLQNQNETANPTHCLMADGVLFATGAAGYTVIELLWRGHTHWSMGVAGGICFTCFGRIWPKIKSLRKIYVPLLGSTIITSVELAFGVVFNLILKKGIWDYSHLPFQLFGQICGLFSTLWGLLSIPAVPLAGRLRQRLIDRESTPHPHPAE